MNASRSGNATDSGVKTTLSETDARQGSTGMGVRYVLASSVGILVVAFAVAYLLFFS